MDAIDHFTISCKVFGGGDTESQSANFRVAFHLDLIVSTVKVVTNKLPDSSACVKDILFRTMTASEPEPN